jgi:hypothetical protein
MFKYIRPWREKREANQVDSASGKRKSVPVLLSRRWNDDWNAGNNRVFSDSQKYWKKSCPEIFRFPIFVLIWRYIFHEYPAKCVAWILLPTFFLLPERCSKEFFYFYFAAMAPERRVASTPVWNWKKSPPLLPCTVIIERHDYKRIWWTHCSTPVQDGSLDVRL